MLKRRVVITGMGAVSPFGEGVNVLFSELQSGRSGLATAPDSYHIAGMRGRIAGFVPDFDEKAIPRKFRRTMSALSMFAYRASLQALQDAKLSEESIQSGRFGIAAGSTVGSLTALESVFRDVFAQVSLEMIKTGVFFKVMSHTAASNLAQTLGVRGRVLAPAAACATGCQAIGLGYEAITAGKQEWMLCGGSEELHPLSTATFEIMQAASQTFNESPDDLPGPFDVRRDGVVCSEGAGMILLESLDSALVRGADIFAEVLGFACNSDSSNIANPDAQSIRQCIDEALQDSGLHPEAIDYINAHATGTEQGDAAEAEALAEVFGSSVPVSSLKGHLGHTMAASGALELIASIRMMEQSVIVPTRNLDTPDPAFPVLRHVTRPESCGIKTILKNNFALGGVNTALIVGRYVHDR